MLDSWSSSGTTGMGEDGGLYLLCVINYIYSKTGCGNICINYVCHKNARQIFRAALHLIECAPICLSHSLPPPLSLAFYLSCVLPMTTMEWRRTRHFSHNILPIKVAATATRSTSTCHVMARQTTSCKQIRETRNESNRIEWNGIQTP